MAGVAVADYTGARPWYERMFGRPADIVVHDTECMWRIGDGAWLYIVEDEGRAGNALVAISVDDLDAMLRELDDRDVAVARVEPAERGSVDAVIEPSETKATLWRALSPLCTKRERLSPHKHDTGPQ